MAEMKLTQITFEHKPCLKQPTGKTVGAIKTEADRLNTDDVLIGYRRQPMRKDFKEMVQQSRLY